jgi:outer membrane receptor protein involved in Fe transport
MAKLGFTWVRAVGLGAVALAAAPALAQSQAPIPLPATAPADPSAETSLATVTVTATKRRESERSVAGAVTALTGQQLQEVGASNFSDYLTLAPGVQFDQSDPGYSVVSIRGVTTTNDIQQNQTPVGIFFDEVPLTDPFGSIAIPDIDAFDVAQVEIMRGPQGALFGSGALGGAINYVPQRPDLGAWQANVQTSASIGHDRQIGGFGKAMFNVPVIKDTLGVRAVGFARYVPGYIDNTGVNRPDSNSQEYSGGRLMTTWQLRPHTTVSVTGLYQRTHIADQDDSFSGLGTLTKATAFPESADERLDVDDLHLDSDLGFARLVVIGAYQYKYLHFRQDGSYAIAALSTGANSSSGDVITQLIDEVGPLATSAHGYLHGYTSEIRLVSPDSEHFEWLAGAFYADRHEWETEGEDLLGAAAATTPISNLLDELLGPTLAQQYGSATLPGGELTDVTATIKARELAGYVDLSYKFFRHWKLEAGGRFYDNQIGIVGDSNGVLEAASLITQGATPTFDEVIGGKEVGVGFNPKVSLSFTPTSDLLFYTLYSRGFSLGGVNIAPAEPGFTIPATYNSNKLYNLELGAKTSWWHHRLQVDITPYDIYWSNIPLELASPMGTAYLANVGNAHNRGVETSIVVQPVKHLVITDSLTWLQARLGNAYQPSGGSTASLEGEIIPAYASQVIPSGTELPGSAHWQNATIIGYKWPGDSVQYHASFVNRYIDTSPSSIQHYTISQGGYDQMSLRGGWDWGDFQAELFVDNLTDRRGVASRSYIAPSLITSHVVEPRIVGVQITWSP